MKCKDCYHNEICPLWDDYNDIPYCDGYSDFCNNYDHFKDKSLIVELPCKVGDKAYYLSIKRYVPLTHKIVEAEVLNYNINGRGIFDAKIRQLNSDYVFRTSIDKIYFTKSEAEAKLKELNNGTT